MGNKRFDNSVVDVPSSGSHPRWGKIGSAQDRMSERMDVSFHFSLTPSQEQAMQERLDAGDVMTIEEIARDFGADPDQVATLADWLKSNGYSKIDLSPDGRTVSATAPASVIETTLSCKMVTVGGEIGTSVAPVLPISVADLHSINGLQPFIKKYKNARKDDRIMKSRNLSKSAVNLSVLPFRAASVKAAYSVPSSYSGTGQTVGILIDCFPSNSDMTAFWAANSVAGSLTRITKINVRNVVLPAPTGEETLDTQWISAVAPSANIRIYASGDLRISSLNTCLDRMIRDASLDPTFRVVSVSLGIGELMISPGELSTQNAKFVSLRLLGVNVFVSSGDGGSNPYGTLQVEFPSCSPNVVSVGGTSLSLSAAGAVISETAWSGSGGGSSTVFAKPTWQSVLPGTKRLLPDVSALANPATGAYVFLAGRVWQFGGTSLSAPIWAGICALANDARVRAGKRRLGYLPSLIYPIYAGKFRDIVAGNNGAYSATAGYDKVTGVGTPLTGNLIAALVALP